MSDEVEAAPVVAPVEVPPVVTPSDVASSTATAPKPKAKAGGPKAKGKKAQQPVEDIKYEYGDIVLGRLRGYPPWPARITDPEDLPANVLSQRPKSASVYCTQFFPQGDFSWLAPRDISPLKPHQIDAFINEPHRKASGALRDAYRTAQDPTEWDATQAAARRQIEEAEEDVDQLEEEEELDDDEAPKSGKRKRASQATRKESNGKKAKTSKKAEPKAAKADKPKSDKKADKAAPVDESGEPLDPEAIKVKDWRHKLQRAFLVKGVPDASEMDQYDKLFTEIESYDGMKVEYLQFSKIGKVLKKIAALGNIARNDELQITNRATKLMNKWQNEIIQPGGSAESANGDSKPEETPAAAAPAATPVAAAPATEEAPAAEAPAEEKTEA